MMVEVEAPVGTISLQGFENYTLNGGASMPENMNDTENSWGNC